ncbi:MAG: hemerythrin domain-containing protein, partial [Bacteroidales bacterium]|nr:hemerythrin domain-containing protein [Bacteroidales bacterium]
NKLTKVISADFSLLPVMNRFGIQLGIKDKTIAEICDEKQINTEFFLAIINTYHNPEYFPEKELLSFSPLLIVEYLRKTHKHYIEYVFPQIENLLEKLIDSGGNQTEDLKIIKTFYIKYKNEWVLHIKEEEDNVFPYLRQMIESSGKIKSEYSMHSFEKEHSNVDDKLNDLKNLIIKYIEPSYDNNICNEFLMLLANFEKDSKDHARIEDKILLTQILAIENKKR